MGYLSAVSPLVQARAALWRERARRLLARPGLANVLLVVLGLGGGLAGGALVGEWCLGLVMIAESVLVVFVGFARDDGRGAAVAGERSHAQILAEARRRL